MAVEIGEMLADTRQINKPRWIAANDLEGRDRLSKPHKTKRLMLLALAPTSKIPPVVRNN